MDDIVWSENERCALLMIIPWSPRGADVAISRVQSPKPKTRHYLKLASLSVPTEFPEKETRQGNIMDDAVLIQEKSMTHNAKLRRNPLHHNPMWAKDQGRGVAQCSVSVTNCAIVTTKSQFSAHTLVQVTA